MCHDFSYPTCGKSARMLEGFTADCLVDLAARGAGDVKSSA